ncbi:MAG TPA: 3-hydroxyacyl-ACP dehydratase FabZ family protein [Gemmataceae bacterium]|nr:3-hydroxyacyl-ACP dehydratase FabZ family protein [Gemmataceae bacterium]
MQFHLLDRIVSCEPGKALSGFKRLTMGEEYLADHFPGFPIMPGVLQLQALVEAASWLVRITDDFNESLVVLREVKAVKYASMVKPGNVLNVTVEITQRESGRTACKGKGECDGTQTVSAQFVVAHYNLRDRNPAFAERDERLVRQLRSWKSLLTGELDAR